MWQLAQIEAALEATGSAITEVRGAERWRLEQAWREVYARATHLRTGRWRIENMEWNVFVVNDAPHKSAANAIALFLAEEPSTFYVWPEEATLPMCKCVGGSHRPLATLNTDIYVFPPDLSWTMAFTHEQQGMGLGPYFSRREWQPTE